MTLKKRLSVKLIAFAVALQTAGGIAEPGIQADTALLGDVDYGIICPIGDIVRIPAEGTTLGYITQRQAAQQISLTTQTIPLINGIGFGVRSQNISGGRLGPIQITVTHPNFPGHNSTQDVWQDTFETDSINFNFFTFEFPFEMQTGVWTFTASRFDQPIYSVTFKVVDPKTVPQLAAVCAGPVLTS
jgi:hypothetical protein